MKSLLLILVCIPVLTLSQKNPISISFPDATILFKGYSIVLEVGFKKKEIKGITIECNECDTLYQVTPGRFLLRPGDESFVKLLVKNKKGKVISTIDYPVTEVPPPFILLDEFTSQTIISYVPAKINLKVQQGIPIQTKYLITSWKIIIGKEIFSGSQGDISNEVKTYLKTIQKGKLIIELDYMDPFGRQKIQGVFDFDL